MLRLTSLLLVWCCLWLNGSAQVAPELMTLNPGQPVEREIKGGESHHYQIALTAGQFVRFRLEQKVIDAALLLTTPDGRQLAEMDLAGVGEAELLSLEAAATGSYRLTVRTDGATKAQGAYRLEATLQAAALEPDRQWLKAETLMLEAAALRKQGNQATPQAIEKLQQALPLWRELNEPLWTALTLDAIGSAFYTLRQHEKAIEFHQQALALSRESLLRAREGLALYHLGDAAYGLRRFEQAIEYYTQALPIRRELKDRLGEGDVLESLGTVWQTMRRPAPAMDFYTQALALRREIGDRRGEAISLHDLGQACLSSSRSEEAMTRFEQALAIFREVGDRAFEGHAIEGLGLASMSLSRYEQAIENYERSLAIKRELNQQFETGFTLTNLGVAYAALGRYEKAIEYNEQALAINRETKSRVGEGRSLYSLGATWSALGRYEKAIEYLEQALTITRALRDRLVEGYTLSALGTAWDKQGRAEKAIEAHEQALVIYRDIKRRPQEGSTLNSLAGAYRSLKQYDKSIQYSEQALAISREVKNPEYELGALSGLARTESERGNLIQARTYIEDGLRVAESLRADLISPASRATQLALVQGSYQLYTDILMRQHKAEPAKGYDALALAVSERQRARSLLDLLAESSTDLRQGTDPALIERERTLAKQLSDKAQQLSQTAKPEAAAALKKEIGQLETDLERAQVAIRKASPRYAALTQPQPLSLKEIQQQLDADTVLLEYALGEERSYLWAITSETLSSYELPKAAQINQSAREFYELLTARSVTTRGESAIGRQQRLAQSAAKLPAAAAELSRLVLSPVAAQLGNKRLVIVADGALQYVPFAALAGDGGWGMGNGAERLDASSFHLPSSIPQPLIVSHEIISLPSASALAIQRSELAGRQPAPKLLAVVADPVFDRTDARLNASATATGDKAQPAASVFAETRIIEHLADQPGHKSGVNVRHIVIPRLPYTRQEADQLLALAPKEAVFKAVDFQASRAIALSPELSRYRYVHFATHGLLDAERPGLSSLVLSLVDAQGRAQNGFLRANDIYNLKLPAELVVLSACQTGLGREIKGEGLVGLTRGFMYAGAARVVVSLWSVNDKATADLMTRFYQKMLKQGERPAAALRAAQVEMWKQKQWQSPFYWAAFVLQGEWK
ncbi:MAG: CHAT domain-containing tetratricopeptide repeat protein [Blastocatellia bacterium]